MGRTYRRDDQYSWGKYSKDKRQRPSERYKEETTFSGDKPRKLKGNKFDAGSDYYEEGWYE